MIEVPVTVGVSNGNYVEIKDGIVPGETVYKVAAKEETPTGLAALFSNAFTNRQVNRTNRRNTNSNGSGMPDYNNMPGGSFPGGGSSQGGGSRGN